MLNTWWNKQLRMSAWYILQEYSAVGEEMVGGSQKCVTVCATYNY
jgi:hypothetical protein